MAMRDVHAGGADTMADFLVIYGTTDGQTARIADRLGAELRSSGATVDVANAASASPSLGAYKVVVVAASVHAGGYQKAVARWIGEHRAALARRPTAFVSVCLGVLQHDAAVDAELDDIMNRFFQKTGWFPTVRKIVAGALLYTHYNIIKRWTMRRIVKKAGGDTDTTRDYEYTDWADLAAFARTLIPLASPRPAVVERRAQVSRPEQPAESAPVQDGAQMDIHTRSSESGWQGSSTSGPPLP
jgi:menaquinone-dependent protoporphyrinogen oxidase